METAMLLEWEQTCAKRLGKVLDLNMLDFDEESGLLSIGYRVPDGSPPLITRDGVATRIIAIDCSYKELAWGPTH